MLRSNPSDDKCHHKMSSFLGYNFLVMNKTGIHLSDIKFKVQSSNPRLANYVQIFNKYACHRPTVHFS